jgi:hypothetical protein
MKPKCYAPHSYISELDCDFKKTDIKEFMLRMKNNKGTGYDWIPAEVWKVILHYER